MDPMAAMTADLVLFELERAREEIGFLKAELEEANRLREQANEIRDWYHKQYVVYRDMYEGEQMRVNRLQHVIERMEHQTNGDGLDPNQLR